MKRLDRWSMADTKLAAIGVAPSESVPRRQDHQQLDFLRLVIGSNKTADKLQADDVVHIRAGLPSSGVNKPAFRPKADTLADVLAMAGSSAPWPTAAASERLDARNGSASLKSTAALQIRTRSRATACTARLQQCPVYASTPPRTNASGGGGLRRPGGFILPAGSH
jgi:hypothetical protein